MAGVRLAIYREATVMKTAALALAAALVALTGCQQSNERVGDGARDGGSASPTYRPAPRVGDTGPTAPSGGVVPGVPSSNNEGAPGQTRSNAR
jgi:hypothetical protein